MTLFQGIPAKVRNVGVSSTRVRLYHQLGMERPAMAACRELVREQPTALEAVCTLPQLGLTRWEVHEVGDAASHSLWLEGGTGDALQ